MMKNINKVIKLLIYSDFAINSGWGLMSPIFSLFILENIVINNPAEAVRVAGFASLFYWLTKSLLQIPIGKYLDKNHGEKDDFWFMVGGTFLASFAPFGFFISSKVWHIYFFQVLHALAMAMAVPSWSAIFTRHIDKGKEAYEWGLYSTSLGFAVGIAGALGGLAAGIFGFRVIFLLAGFLTIISSLILLLIQKEIIPRDNIFPPTPHSIGQFK